MLKFFYKILCVLILAFQIIEGAESHKQMVLTFDDLPLSPGPLYSIEKRSEIYVEKLAKVPVKAAFFCVGNNLKKWKEDGLAGVKKIVEAGHPICNHTFSHHHLSEKTVQDFLQDVGLNETIFSAMLTYEKWFRYPYMDIGLDQKTNGSIEKARSCAEALNQAGYSYGYATIDTFDWYLNSLLKEAMLEGKLVEESRLKKFYVEHIKDLLTHFSNQETEIDVLLMHLNDINALCLDEIISAIQETGWTLVDPKIAYQVDGGNWDRIFKKFERQTETKPLSFYSLEHLSKKFQEQVLHSKTPLILVN